MADAPEGSSQETQETRETRERPSAPPERPSAPPAGPPDRPSATGTTTTSLFVMAHVRWADVWTRAVILPAWRRAGAIWVGCAIAAALIFGPTGMHPEDLTGLALHHAGVGAALGVTWLLVYVPTARLLLRAEAAAYLRTLPGPRFAPLLIGGGAFVVGQLPWLALWVIGEGPRGLAVVALESLAILALASFRPPAAHAGWPRWKHDGEALRAIHLRALRRRAGDALVRGAGLAVLAGAAAGLFVRNNALTGQAAAAVGAAVIAVLLVPAYVGVLLVILGAHRQTAWLAETLGIAPGTRVAALVFAIAVVQLGASAIALAAAALVAEPDGRTLAWLAAVTLGCALGSSLGSARALLGSQASETVAARAVVGAIVVAAAAVLCLGLLGAAGAIALCAAGLGAALTARA
ncbi:MAG TPA: hypothetical protein VNO30_03535 [Kofleriaceae bacterium]|nr:hypothetical protein [Kofleriaceae bacterium]